MSHIKIARTDYPVLDVIKNRWSPRAFTSEIVSEEKINSVFEAARWAASSGNEQPWEYYYALKNTEGWDKLFNCLDDGNRLWVKHATMLIAAVTNTKFRRGGAANRTADHDLGLANGHLFLQAVAEGFYLHPMAGFYPGKVKETLKLSDDKKIVCMIAGGYLGDPEMLDEKNKKSEITPRKRRPITEFVTKL